MNDVKNMIGVPLHHFLAKPPPDKQPRRHFGGGFAPIGERQSQTKEFWRGSPERHRMQTQVDMI